MNIFGKGSVKTTALFLEHPVVLAVFCPFSELTVNFSAFPSTLPLFSSLRPLLFDPPTAVVGHVILNDVTIVHCDVADA